MPDREVKEPKTVIHGIKEQWLHQGDCKECRRKSYCKKPCKAHKEKIENDIYEKIVQKTVEKTGIFMNIEAVKEFI